MIYSMNNKSNIFLRRRQNQRKGPWISHECMSIQIRSLRSVRPPPLPPVHQTLGHRWDQRRKSCIILYGHWLLADYFVTAKKYPMINRLGSRTWHEQILWRSKINERWHMKLGSSFRSFANQRTHITPRPMKPSKRFPLLPKAENDIMTQPNYRLHEVAFEKPAFDSIPFDGQCLSSRQMCYASEIRKFWSSDKWMNWNSIKPFKSGHSQHYYFRTISTAPLLLR